MASFASVYRPSKQQESFLARTQNKELKRKWQAKEDDDSDAASQGDASSLSDRDNDPKLLHPVNRTDQFYVAGYAREKPLPGGNFPHAAIKETAKPQSSVEEEMSRLRPPLYLSKPTVEANSGSLKRRHMDNLTALMHKCMLNGDWQRASRLWGLLLRTEINGQAIDIRSNDRWMLGAELLMRRSQALEQCALGRGNDSDRSDSRSQEAASVPVISAEGFQQAREYYERLILQYPHSTRTQHRNVNALTIYPALFNVWIYEVQDHAKRARNALKGENDASSPTSPSDSDSGSSSDSLETQQILRTIREAELAGAQAIAQKLDDILPSPPYDTSAAILQYRAMVALWISDMHRDLARGLGQPSREAGEDEEDDSGMIEDEASMSNADHLLRELQERSRAREVFTRMEGLGMELPTRYAAFLQEEGELEE